MGAIRRILIAIKDCEAKTTPALVKGVQLARALGNTAERVERSGHDAYVAHQGSLDYRPNTPTGACFVVRFPSTRQD